MSKILDGRAYAQVLRAKLKQELQRVNMQPQLAVVLVGDDKPSHTYVRLKEKVSQELGIQFHKYLLPTSVGSGDIVQVINFLNEDQDIDGIIVQLPLPKGLDSDLILRNIDPAKDADGFHTDNVRRFLAGDKDVLPPGLVEAIMRLILLSGESLTNKRAVVVAKSPIIVEPLAKILNDHEVGVEWVKPTDLDLVERTKAAHLVITAVGKAWLLNDEHLKPGAIVIDLGANYIAEGVVVGDVDYNAVFSIVDWITPVPGGVGPMTVAMLMWRTYQLACRRAGVPVMPVPLVTPAEIQTVNNK